mgnify:CR=1 FL=1
MKLINLFSSSALITLVWWLGRIILLLVTRWWESHSWSVHWLLAWELWRHMMMTLHWLLSWMVLLWVLLLLLANHRHRRPDSRELHHRWWRILLLPLTLIRRLLSLVLGDLVISLLVDWRLVLILLLFDLLKHLIFSDDFFQELFQLLVLLALADKLVYDWLQSCLDVH